MQHTREQKRGQRLIIQYEVGRVLSESRDLGEVAPRILAAIGQGLAWDYAGLWTVDRREDVLRCAQAWHAPSVDCSKFEAISRRVTFAAGVGLPGRVWASGEPLWITDISRDANFARMLVAVSEGLHSAAAFPILLGGRVLGVFEFLSGDARDRDQETLEMMALLGGQIGQFLERERSREAVEESEARKAAVLESALDAIITMDHDGRVVEWNPAAERTFGYPREGAVGREMAELIVPPSLRQRHRQGLAKYLGTGEGVVIGRRIEITAMRSDGSEFPVELAITRVP
ncbi:MAG: PAS domain S-box protein, partial [Chloroflexota bacterium]|nr:PAS domain S-box protein [Chloroflexota bacterium]